MSDTLIYIRELGPATDCWHPAEGVQISADVYRVTAVPADKSLEFRIGDHVRCAQRAFPDGSEALLAVGRATQEKAP